MIIGIDGNEADYEQKVGVHQYAYELLHEFYRIAENRQNGLIFQIYLKKPPSPKLPTENEYWHYKILPGKGFWVLRQLLPEMYKKDRPDVLFIPSHYLPPISPIPMVCTIHDLGYLNFSEQFKKYDFWQLKYWSAISIIVSKYIIAVSNSTKNEIVRHYHFASKKIVTIYHGYDRKRFNNNIYANVVRRIKEKYEIKKDYILFLSMLKPSKNIGGLITAFSILKKKNVDVSLVIAGKKGWLYDSIFKKVKEFNLEKDIIFTDFVAEEDKPGLMAGAKVFVSPSFWEGFGMHVLEAMACGTPVVVSKVASLPEVAGKAGIYVDPDEPTSIADGLEKVLGMPQKEYNKLVKATFKQAENFAWGKTAQQTLNLLKKVVKNT